MAKGLIKNVSIDRSDRRYSAEMKAIAAIEPARITNSSVQPNKKAAHFP